VIVFVAGATGATGQAFVQEVAQRPSIEVRLHVRPQSAAKTPLAQDPRARIFDLGDASALEGALRGCDAVVSFVGTMRQRFESGDTYASSDVGSARALVAGARAAGVPRFLLLSSLGAGGAGAYLKMKGECERIVRESGLAWTIFRPSAFETPPGTPVGHHGERKASPGAHAVFGALRHLPGAAGWVDDVRPITLDVLARAFLAVLEGPQPSRILSGRDLWALGGIAPRPR
jgi:uncharacterized protein YbjT (DUF2867 family)